MTDRFVQEMMSERLVNSFQEYEKGTRSCPDAPLTVHALNRIGGCP